MFNFVLSMVYTLLFQELYRQARFFGGKLLMDVDFWLDEMANIKSLSGLFLEFCYYRHYYRTKYTRQNGWIPAFLCQQRCKDYSIY